MPIKVMIVDDHEIVRTGLAAVINKEEDMLLAAEAASGQEAIEMFPRILPDVTLIDIRLPGIEGPEVIGTIRKDFPNSKFVVLTTFEHDEDIFRSYEAGAAGYLLKGMFNVEFIDAIRRVYAGLRCFPTRIAQRLDGQRQVALTGREQDVLHLLVQGKSNREIAESLQIAESTVRWFLTIIYGKLEVRDRAQAITVALRRGLIHLSSE